MPWVKFSADFDWNHNPRSLVAYRAGESYLVSQAAADAAQAAGKGQVVPDAERPTARRKTKVEG